MRGHVMTCGRTVRSESFGVSTMSLMSTAGVMGQCRPVDLGVTVDIGAVVDSNDPDHVRIVVEAEQHSVVAVAGTAQVAEFTREGLAEPARVGRQALIDEGHHRESNLGRQSSHVAAPRGRPLDAMRHSSQSSGRPSWRRRSVLLTVSPRSIAAPASAIASRMPGWERQ